MNKTKIVCTIGPASESRETMEHMLRAGMNIARLNFSHGDFPGHERVIGDLRAAARSTGHSLTIMADLPGPKIRIGVLAKEPVYLRPGDSFTLTTEDVVGNRERASVTFSRLPQTVNPGDRLSLNDGLIQLQALQVTDKEVCCQVIVGGELRSRKGLNLPGIDLGVSAFTDHDRECLRFALEKGVDAISQSFVESATDIAAVRDAAASQGHHPFIIAKIERAGALGHMDDILAEADGIMIARGDLGVEIPIEEIAVVQKRLTLMANLRGKPVITATQMLESMINNRLPSRAEATDVANAILDGTDCVMLSGESAMGRYPVDAVKMMGKIAVATEPFLIPHKVREALEPDEDEAKVRLTDLIALSVGTTVERVAPAAVIVPTYSGSSPRSIARFRLPVWITAVSTQEDICRQLQFSYGVYPVCVPEHPEDWNQFAREWLTSQELLGNLVVLTEGPSKKNPDANNRMEIIDINGLHEPEM